MLFQYSGEGEIQNVISEDKQILFGEQLQTAFGKTAKNKYLSTTKIQRLVKAGQLRKVMCQ